MGRKRVDEQDKKVPITLKLSKKLVDEIKKIPGYNPKIEKILSRYFMEKK